MKIAFIFQPSKSWTYCGGGMVILADTFEEAQKLIGVEEKLFISEKDSEKEEYDWNTWILVEKIQCSKEKKSRIVFCDYNWA